MTRKQDLTAEQLGDQFADAMADNLKHNVAQAKSLPAAAKLADRPLHAPEECADLEQRYRRMLWLRHGHDTLYGDDGEMQCSECLGQFGFYDYKRAPLEILQKADDTLMVQRMSWISQVLAELDQYRKKCPDAYTGIGALETVLSIIRSAGQFGALAGKYSNKLARIREAIEYPKTIQVSAEDRLTKILGILNHD